MRFGKQIAIAALMLATVAAPQLAHAGLLGDQMSLTYFFPNLATPFNTPLGGYAPQTFTVNGTKEVTSFGDTGNIQFSATVANDTLTLVFLGSDTFTSHSSSVTFNGVVFHDITGNDIAGFSLASDSGSGLSTTTSFDANDLRIDWSGGERTGETLVFDVSFPSTSTVPEPAALAIFGFGLAGLGMIRRRKANAADPCGVVSRNRQ